MAGIKLVASDLDGTLLTHEAGLTEENSRAITEIVKRGVLFVPTTGRCLSEVPDFIKNHPSIEYIISSNGANITNLKTGECFPREMPAELSAKVYAILKKYPVFTCVHANKEGYVDPDRLNPESIAACGISPYYLKLFEGMCLPLPDFDRIMSEGIATELFAAFAKDASILSNCFFELSRLPGVEITRSTSGEIEIISDKAGKGKGVLRFAAMMGIHPSEIITAGDSMNDISMLRVAGLSVAAPSALDEVKEEATVRMSDGDGGVAEYILSKYIK